MNIRICNKCKCQVMVDFNEDPPVYKCRGCDERNSDFFVTKQVVILEDILKLSKNQLLLATVVVDK